jgi:hypothetical protein
VKTQILNPHDRVADTVNPHDDQYDGWLYTKKVPADWSRYYIRACVPYSVQYPQTHAQNSTGSWIMPYLTVMKLA